METYQPIDLKALAKKSVPKLAPFIPGFVYRRFEKLLHTAELNDCFEKHFNDSPEDFLAGVQDYLNNPIEFAGPGEAVLKENAGKSIVFAGNHPYGGPESMALMNYLIHPYPHIKLVAQSFLRFIKPLQSVCVYNKKDVRTLMDHVDTKESILIYPAGKCSRKLSNKEVFDYEWHSSFVKIAKRNNMPVVIIYTDGQLSKRFFRWQRIPGKTSFATILLPDEMFKMAGKTLKMVVSKPIDPSVFTDDVPLNEWANRLRQYCYNLRKDPFAEFDPSAVSSLPLN
jgi:hypothetical protein